MDRTTTILADYAVRSKYGDLPEVVVRETKNRLIDTFACAAAAYDEEVCRMARAVAYRQSGTPSAWVWGTGWRSTPEAAAFANGTMLRFLDYNDMYRAVSGGHPSDTIAAVLAVADAMEVDGRKTIDAIVVAYEIYCQFCDWTDLNNTGWDQPVYSVIASAAGAGKLLGLTREEMEHAIALAVAPNMALIQTRKGELSSWKGAAAANASRNGVFAAMLAKAGFTGPSAVFEGEKGLWKLAGEHDVAFDFSSQDDRRIARTNLKSFPVCYHGQSAARAAINLGSRVRPNMIASVLVETYAQAVHEMASDGSRWQPKTRETADHSLPYVVARALTDRRMTQDSFAPHALREPALVALMNKITVRADEELSSRYPMSASCRIEIVTKDGAVIREEVRSPEGHADNPLTVEALKAKYTNLFADYELEGTTEALWDVLNAFEDSGNVSNVIALLTRRENTDKVPMASRPHG